MKSLGNIILILFSAAVLTYAGCGFLSVAMGFLPSSGPATPVTEDKFFHTPWQEETQYAVWAIVDDIARMAAFASKKPVSPALNVSVEPRSYDPPVYSVVVKFGDRRPVVKKELTLTAPLWSEDNFAALARDLLAAAGVKRAPYFPPIDEEMVAADLQRHFTATEIFKQAATVSEGLAREFTNPFLHDEAAVVLGAFRIRETGFLFSDVRASLNRSTAHLAMAAALRDGKDGDHSINRLGRALASLGMNRQAEAVDLAAGLPDSLGPWRTLIRLKATGDWRSWDEGPRRTRMENLAFFEARCANSANQAAISKMKSLGFDDGAEWTRILNDSGPSIQIGHLLLEAAVACELKEIGEIHKLEFGSALSKENLAGALNPPPGPCVSADAAGVPGVRVIGWGLWADFFQRHLFEAIYQDYEFIVERWSNPRAVPEYLEAVKPLHSGLRLGPLLRRMLSTNDAAYHEAMRESYAILRSAPQTVPVCAWNSLCYFPLYKKIREFPDGVLPHINEWHRVNPPPGTAIDLGARADHPSLTDRKDLADKVRELASMAPASRVAAELSLKTAPQGLSEVEAFRSAYAFVLPWSSNARIRLALLLGPGNPEGIELMKSSALLDPDLHFASAQYLVVSGRREEAAREYELGFRDSQDAVLASNNAFWFVMYLLDNGRLDEARKLAASAAETGSSCGMETQAALLERLGDLAAAEEFYKKIEERYSQSGPLTGFRIRRALHSGDQNLVERTTGRVFPRGMKKVTVEALGITPPELGVGIYSNSPTLQQSGLRTGSVVVALDGIRVDSFAQYDLVRSMSSNPEMRIIAWQDHRYQEFIGCPPNRRFGVDMGDYVR